MAIARPISKLDGQWQTALVQLSTPATRAGMDEARARVSRARAFSCFLRNLEPGLWPMLRPMLRPPVRRILKGIWLLHAYMRRPRAGIFRDV
jgi:hypothetical protein